MFELTFTVTPVNDAPVIVAQLTMTTVEDSIYTVTLSDLVYEDVDNSGSDLSILLGQGEFFMIDTTTVFPDNDFVGSITVPTYLFDGQDSSELAFDLVIDVLGVNDAPFLVTGVSDIVVDEDSDRRSFSLINNDGDAYFSDNDFEYGDLLSYSVEDGLNNLLMVTVDEDSVHIDFMPDSNGVDTIYVTATDLSGQFVIDTIVVTVTPVNDAPVIVAQLTMTTVEDSIYTVTLSDLVYEDVDNSGSDLSILLGQGEFFTIDTTTVFPDNDFVGSITVPTYLFDGQDSSELAFDLVIDVLGINDAPFLVTGVSDIVVDEDSDRRSFSLINNDGDAYFSDNDFEYGDLLSYSVEDGLNNLLMVTVDEDSVHIDFMPDSNGVDTIYVTATDLSGQFVIDTIVVTVTPVNDAPVIVGVLSEFEIDEDDSIMISIDDFSIIDVENDNVTISIIEGDNYITNGLMVIPAENYFGSLIVSVAANDGSASSEPFQINISVNGINDIPLNFDLLSPANGEIITMLNSDIIENEVIPVSWTQSDDVDGDLIYYNIEMSTESWSQIIISNLPDTSYNLPFALIVSILDTLNVSEISIDWTVFSTDGMDTVYADQILH